MAWQKNGTAKNKIYNKKISNIHKKIEKLKYGLFLLQVKTTSGL
jgi:hypothetical protein